MTPRVLVLALAAGMTSACVSVLPDAGPPPDIYRLSPPAPAGQAHALIVEVPAPLAPKSLASDRLAVVTGERLAYLSGARWETSAPRLLQAHVIAAFDSMDAGGDGAAIRPGDGVRAPFELRLDIVEFEAVYPDAAGQDAPTARLRVRAKLIDNVTRRLIASRSLEARTPAAANRVGEIVKALDAVSDEVAETLVSWTLEMAPQSELESGPQTQAASAPEAGSGAPEGL